MNTAGLTSTSLASTPTQRLPESENTESSSTAKFMNQVKSELQAQKIFDRTNNELHRKRVDGLRKELEYLKATEWKYKPVDW